MQNVLFGGAYSVGDASGTNPVSGGAVWTGAMFGADESETTAGRGRAVSGDARKVIPSFTTPTVNVLTVGVVKPYGATAGVTKTRRSIRC